MINIKSVDIWKKSKNILEKNSKVVLAIIFAIGLLIGIFFINNVTSISYLRTDEELYINMARSFFYNGVFSKGYEILNYNCVIYSMIISIAYFFYSSGTVLFFMRLIGVTLMVSAIFPIYLLSKSILNSKIKALGLAMVWLILPEMGLSVYIIQEVLLYPVFLWTAYLIYLKFTGKKSKILDLCIIILFGLMFFIKSFAISFAAAYFLALMIIEGKKNIKNIIIQGAIFALIVAIGYLGVYAINDFQTGTNHYTRQMAHIFPITIKTFINFAYGMWYYAVFFLFCTGILPIIVPILNIKRYKENDRKFMIFLILSAIVTIIEVVIIVFIPEESNKLYPYKFCYRYMFVLMMPFLIMFLKLKNEDIKKHILMTIVYVLVFGYLIWYYIGQGAFTTSIDSPVMFCMQRAYGNKNSILLLITATVVSASMLILSRKDIKNIKSTYIKIALIGSLFFTHRYWFSILDLLHEDNGGRALQKDFKVISEIIQEADYDKIYLIDHAQNLYLYVMTIGGELNKEYRDIEMRRYSKYTK